MPRPHLLRLLATACALLALSGCEGRVASSDAVPTHAPDEARGALTVRLDGFLSHVQQRRQTLGLPGEVSRVVVTVASAESTDSQILDREDLEATAAVDFTELPPGPVVVTSEAFSGEERPGMSVVGHVTVQADRVAELRLLPEAGKIGEQENLKTAMASVSEE